jgi:hypothetical protein
MTNSYEEKWCVDSAIVLFVGMTLFFNHWRLNYEIIIGHDDIKKITIILELEMRNQPMHNQSNKVSQETYEKNSGLTLLHNSQSKGRVEGKNTL